MDYCSPLRQGGNSWTCFTINELMALCEMWNKTEYSKGSKIDIPHIQKIVDVSQLCKKLNYHIDGYNKSASNSIVKSPIKNIGCVYPKKYIWSILYNKFFPFCGIKNEVCWIDNKDLDIKHHLEQEYPDLYKLIDKFVFKPQGTKDQYGWLSTTNIIDVMRQYETVYTNFKFIDCVPSDNYILYPHEFPNNETISKYRYLAVVFNIDETHKPGSHWVTVFFENTLDEFGNKILLIEYFDSVGNPPIPNISKFMHHKQLDVFNKKYLVNKFKHQKGDSECGIFALFYIQKRIQGYSFDDFQHKRLSDTMMNQYRSEFFRPHME